ncbi:MAG TPA: lytic transglycosylase domain-containing protein [Blastocatellia bacterium]|nr:lytic transglycosylase domain-containing protein [Blastocatellia bacterium]
MSRYIPVIAVIFLFAVFVRAQSETGQGKVTLDNWDVGAVKVVTEPKPAPVAKGKATDGKQTAKNQKATSKETPKANVVASAKIKQTPKDDKPTEVQVIDLTAASGETEITAAAKSTNELSGRADLDKIIDNASQETGVDPKLIYSVMRQESGFHNGAVSPKGARGLMQLIPSTAERFGVKNIFDPKENIRGGAKYLRFLLDTFNGDVELALAGYNAGEGAVIRYGYKIPPYSETQNYVRNIVSRYGQRTSRPTDITAGLRTISAPIVVSFSDKGGLMLSNNY